MNNCKIYVRAQDIERIGQQLIQIIDEAISQVEIQKTQSMMERIIGYTLETYLNFAQEHFCQGFINYYDFQGNQNNSHISPSNESPFTIGRKRQSFVSVPQLLSQSRMSQMPKVKKQEELYDYGMKDMR